MTKKDSDKGANTTSGRRNLLKSIAVGSGVAASAVHTLPKKWVSPLVDSVVLPAHAALSGQTGVYAGDVVVVALNTEPGGATNPPQMIAKSSGIGHDILEFLVPSAQASHWRTGWCNASAPMLMMNVNEDAGTVDICASWLGGDDDGSVVDQASSTLSGNTIADFLLTGGDDEVDEGGGISIFGCTISADGQSISGNHRANGDGPSSCSGTFTLARSTVPYSCTATNDGVGGPLTKQKSGH